MRIPKEYLKFGYKTENPELMLALAGPTLNVHQMIGLGYSVIDFVSHVHADNRHNVMFYEMLSTAHKHVSHAEFHQNMAIARGWLFNAGHTPFRRISNGNRYIWEQPVYWLHECIIRQRTNQTFYDLWFKYVHEASALISAKDRMCAYYVAFEPDVRVL